MSNGSIEAYSARKNFILALSLAEPIDSIRGE